ncbi:hypothetical protein CHS0354_018001 [Potamilus streckersoni]|uniref:Uncharacterized protein n=1 Tax=Potamilus streckersoni TaxID=2493646 RepID=A0AAE0VJS2_9BIVA|nr:hypothetical protein CHS0354_018001 [Potamilus streckersoni]
MAASGNAEHLEAIRKQRVIDRQAYKKKLLRESFQQDLGENPNLIGTEKQYNTSYDREVDLMRKVGSPPGIPKSSPNPHNAAAVDSYIATISAV